MNDCQLNVPPGPLIVPALAQEAAVWFSLIVPTYNENGNVLPLIEGVVELLDQRYCDKFEIIFVDDNSPDGTGDKVKAAAKRYPQVRLILRTNERGLATAVVRGWQSAQGAVLGVMDGDLQHPVQVLVELLAKIESGADLVLASRYTEKGGVGSWGMVRHLLSQSATSMSLLVLPEATRRVTDPMSGCFALRRSAIAGRLLEPEGYKILLEVLARGEMEKVEEVPYVFQLRRHGTTKVSWRQYIEYIRQLLRLRLYLWKRVPISPMSTTGDDEVR